MFTIKDVCKRIFGNIYHCYILCSPSKMSANESSASDSILETDRLTILEKEVGELSKHLTGFIINNKVLKKRVNELTEENNEMYDKFYKLENYICDLDQYSRRNNVEFHNIPESIGNNEIEKYIIKVLGSIGVEVESYVIVAIH